MDIPVHNQILWTACSKATRELGLNEDADTSPMLHFPRMVRGGWINDMNQASCFFDMAGNVGGMNQFPEVVFHQLWALDVEEMLKDLAQHMGGAFANKVQARMDPLSEDMYDAGRYDPKDHLDAVDPPESASDWLMPNDHGVAKPIEDALHKAAATRVYDAMGAENIQERMSMGALTRLGRALHSMQDFYAHTNYVEVLLWHMAQRGALPRVLVDAFNQPVTFLEHQQVPIKRTLLAGYGHNVWDAGAPIFFSYGDSCEDTPITGGLFNTLDTIYTILGIYQKHLLSTDTGGNDDAVVSMIFGLVDFPHKDMARICLNIYDRFSDFIDSIGNFVRNAAMDFLAGKLTNQFPGQADKITSAFSIFRLYGSQEANDWARAGKLGYLRRVIELSLLEKFNNYNPGNGLLLPNHSLLNKDHPPNHPLDMVRFNLACHLATQASTELLVEFFSGGDDHAEVFDKYCVHPTKHSANFYEGELAHRVEQMFPTYWRSL